MGSLFGDYTYSELDAEAFAQILEAYRDIAWADKHYIPVGRLLSESEKQRREDLGHALGHRQALYLQLICAGEICGWFFGHQLDESRFLMVNTQIFPEHRNQGVYSALLRKIMKWAAKQGYQELSSHHHATNNAVLVPKLKAGFLITGLEMDLPWGWMVRLSYFLNPQQREVARYRSGEKVLSEALRLKLGENP